VQHDAAATSGELLLKDPRVPALIYGACAQERKRCGARRDRRGISRRRLFACLLPPLGKGTNPLPEPASRCGRDERVPIVGRIPGIQHLGEDCVRIRPAPIRTERMLIVHPGVHDDSGRRLETIQEPVSSVAGLSAKPVLSIADERFAMAKGGIARIARDLVEGEIEQVGEQLRIRSGRRRRAGALGLRRGSESFYLIEKERVSKNCPTKRVDTCLRAAARPRWRRFGLACTRPAAIVSSPSITHAVMISPCRSVAR
jgi:hypothetical protein